METARSVGLELRFMMDRSTSPMERLSTAFDEVVAPCLTLTLTLIGWHHDSVDKVLLLEGRGGLLDHLHGAG